MVPEPGPEQRLRQLLDDPGFRDRARTLLLGGSDVLRDKHFLAFLQVLNGLGLFTEGPERIAASDMDYWFRIGNKGVIISLFSKGNQGGAHKREWERIKQLCAKQKTAHSPRGVICVAFLRTKDLNFPPQPNRVGRVTRVVFSHLGDDDARVVFGTLAAAGLWGGELRDRHIDGLQLQDHLRDPVEKLIEGWRVLQSIRQKLA